MNGFDVQKEGRKALRYLEWYEREYAALESVVGKAALSDGNIPEYDAQHESRLVDEGRFFAAAILASLRSDTEAMKKYRDRAEEQRDFTAAADITEIFAQRDKEERKKLAYLKRMKKKQGNA